MSDLAEAAAEMGVWWPEPEPLVIGIERTEVPRHPDRMPSVELRNRTGITDRRLHYWIARGVFGPPCNPGQGHALLWHRHALVVVPILVEIADELGEANGIGLDVLRRVVENFATGRIELTENLSLTWSTPTASQIAAASAAS